LLVRLKMPEYCKTLFKVQMKLLSLGLVSEAQDAAALTEKSEDSEAGKKAKVREHKFSSVTLMQVQLGIGMHTEY
jgi:hypothetical protein